jgi:hypothetical protein
LHNKNINKEFIMQLNVTQVNARLFSVSKESKMMVADHSDLGNVDLFQRLYDDAADAGFALFNPLTGAVTRWSLEREERNNEDELQVCIFSPCPETLRTFPQLAGWTVHVLND